MEAHIHTLYGTLDRVAVEEREGAMQGEVDRTFKNKRNPLAINKMHQVHVDGGIRNHHNRGLIE